VRRPRGRMRTRRAPRGLGARLLLREVWQDACVPSVLGMLSVSWASGNTHLGTEPYAKDARSACLSSSASIIALCQFGETKSLLREPFAWVVDKAFPLASRCHPSRPAIRHPPDVGMHMRLFFLHIRDGDQLVRDPDGSVLHDLGLPAAKLSRTPSLRELALVGCARGKSRTGGQMTCKKVRQL